MQVYKTFFRVAKKHLPPCLMYFGIFLVLILMMSSNASDNANKQFTASSVKVAIEDLDQSDASAALIKYIEENHEIVVLPDYDKETILDYLYYMKIEYYLQIPQGFEEALTNGNYENVLKHSMREDNAAGYFLTSQIDAFLSNVSHCQSTGMSLSDAMSFTSETISSLPETETVTFEDIQEENNNMFYYFQYFAYVILMMMIMGLTPILVAFRKDRLNERSSCGAISESGRAAQIGLAAFTYSLLAWLFLFVAALILYGPTAIFTPEGYICIANSLVFTFITSVITLILSTFSIPEEPLNIVSNILGLGMCFCCGIFVPQYYLGESVHTFARFLPAYWYVKINDMVAGFSGEAFSMNSFWLYFGMECAFLVALFCIYLVCNRATQKKR